MIIKKKDGTPFPTMKSVEAGLRFRKHKGLSIGKIVKVEGGFVIDDGKIDIIETDLSANEPIATIATLPAQEDKEPEIKVESHEPPENNVDIVDGDYEQDYPRAVFTGDFKKPKVTYIPKECKNPAFTYKFLLMESFTHGEMCDNWQIDKEVVRNMKRNRKYKHLVSSSDTLLRRGKYNELVLCRMPMEYKESWKKEQRERNNAALGKVESKQHDIHSAGLGA